jgi:L-fuconolactonase
MKIDSHQHFWNFDPTRDRWITDEMSVIRRDFLPEDLIPEMKSNGMDGSIAVQADPSEQETNFLLELASRHTEIVGVVGWVDLCSSQVRKSLELHSGCRKLRGVRHIVQAEPDDRFMLTKPFLDGIGWLKEFGLTYDILIYPHQLPAAVELVAHFPDQPFVIDHIAKPPIRTGERASWAHLLREIAKFSNVYCKLSGLVTEADWQHWSASGITPYLDIVFEAFGACRLMFGSDWPVCLLAGSYARVVELIDGYTSSLPETEKAGIWGLNAARFYGLQEE